MERKRKMSPGAGAIAFALHVADVGLISGIPDVALDLPGIISEHRSNS